MIFDAIVDREDFLMMSDEEVHSSLDSMFPSRKLYSHSVDWRKSDQYILKSRGTGGDVVIGWRNQDEQARESNHQGHLWDTGNHNKTSLRSDEKGAKRRS